MQRWRGVQAAPPGLGPVGRHHRVFDGVHRGHQVTIGHTVARAQGLGLSAVVVTFDPHPSEVVRPGSHPAILTEAARKAELIEELGVDVLCVIPFTLEFSHLSAETFATTCWSSICTPAWSWSARTSGSAQGGRRRRAAGPARAHVRLHRGGRAAGVEPGLDRGRLVDVHPQLRGRGRRGRRGPGPGPATPAGGRGGPRRPARPRARLPDRQPAHRAVRGGAGRRRVRRETWSAAGARCGQGASGRGVDR